MDTIAAISTPYGKGGVALIRISGSDAVTVASRVFLCAGGKPLSIVPSRRAVYGSIVFPGGGDDGVEEIDTGICTIFRAPHSFTGEDTAEISCHGGILVTQAVLASVLAAGARQADAGEFTRRAFLNGKMGLDAAEALGTLLDARTGEQLRLSRAGMKGILSEKTAEIYRDLTHILSSVFACIDYPDEDLAELSRDEMQDAVGRVFGKLSRLDDTYRTGSAVMEGIPTVIAGRANAGKSSLYNLLAGRDAAIVTDIAGTTRDVLTESLSVGRVTVRLADTAGIRDTSDAVERIGVERALRELAQAGLVLAVFDASSPLSEDDLSLIRRLKLCSSPVIVLLNKCDLPPVVTSELVSSAFEDENCPPPAAILPISAATGEGKDALIAAVESLFIDGSLDPATDAILVNARQHAAVLRAKEAVGEAQKSLAAGLPVDLCCDDLETAMSALSELDGRAVSEDVVADIFSRFCVGK